MSLVHWDDAHSAFVPPPPLARLDFLLLLHASMISTQLRRVRHTLSGPGRKGFRAFAIILDVISTASGRRVDMWGRLGSAILPPKVMVGFASNNKIRSGFKRQQSTPK